MTINAWPLDAVDGEPEYAGRELRQTSVSPFVTLGDVDRPLGALSGVRRGTPADTVTATSSEWTLHPHVGILDVEAAGEAGAYAYAVSASESGDIDSPDSSYARIDLVGVQLSDPAEQDGTTVPGVEAVYVAGDPAATPTAPDAPERFVTLAQLNVPKFDGGDPSVTWVAWEVAPGTPAAQTKDQLDSWTTAADGQRAIVLADNSEYVSSDGAWKAWEASTEWTDVTFANADWSSFSPTTYGEVQARTITSAGVKRGFLRGAPVGDGGWTANTKFCDLPTGMEPEFASQHETVNGGVTIQADGKCLASAAHSGTGTIALGELSWTCPSG